MLDRPRPKAFSYLRFSTPEQAQGDSFRRQSEQAAAYAAAHGLEMDDTLRLEDLGVSGFRGRNARKGALRQFLDVAEEGLVPDGSYLLVENLDRVSRQSPWEALPTFQQIINAGIIIVTLQDGRVWSREELQANPFRIMESLFVMIRANEESEVKSRRLKASWVNKRRTARDQKLTARIPGWLRMNAERQFEVIEERAAVVRRIYALTLAGFGQHRIAETLNREKVPTFGRSEIWNRSYVKKVLENPAVVGTYVPHEMEHDDNGRRVRKPLAPLPGYYPGVVDREAFERVQAMRIGSEAPRVRGDKAELANILAGLARCPPCGSTMTRVNKGSGPKGGKPYLVCTKAKAGAGCEYRAVRLERVEEAIRAGAGVLTKATPIADLGLEREWRDLDKKRNAVMEEKHTVMAKLGVVTSSGLAVPTLMRELDESLRALADEKRRLDDRESELSRQMATASASYVRARLEELDAELRAAPLDRAAVNTLLRQLFGSVTVDYEAERLRFTWKRGGELSVGLSG